ncbi:MAG: sigma-70 family RNA polymerase sigma factor [Planctomycetota bacterium]|nr:sigma-70 family RNA polymerase sigma factor [Planctomycetota bacterium]
MNSSTKNTPPRSSATPSVSWSIQTFVRLYQSFDNFKSGHPLRPYLLKITHHVALKALAQRKKSKTSPQLDSLIDPQINPEKREIQSIVIQSLQSLAPEYRSILTLRHMNGLKLKELSVILDCTERTTRNRLHTAAVLFERELERHGLGKDA